MPRLFTPWLAVLAMAVGGLSTSISAGEASSSFQVSVELRPADAGTGCTTALDAAGSRVVRCGGAGGEVVGIVGDEARMRVHAASRAMGTGVFVVGEYSSRTVVAGDFEYVEMTLTW